VLTVVIRRNMAYIIPLGKNSQARKSSLDTDFM